MQVEGEFETFTVVDEDEKYTFYGVPFVQNGFAYTAYLDLDTHIFLSEGIEAYGSIHGDVVAGGTITSLTPITREGIKYLRLSVDPQFPHETKPEQLQ